jgi:uncharacterized membrane protein YhaH (DUF805 family)
VSFQEAVQTVLTQKYFDFSGRARRSEYWFFALFSFLVYLVAYVIGLAIGTQILYYLVALGFLLPGLGVAVRRLHDTGKSGWWILIGIIPLIGAIVLLVFTVTDSDPGDNQYGPSPKALEGGGGYNPNPNATWGQG